MPDSPSPWLWPQSDSEPAALRRLGEVLREYREANHLSQAALGALLQVDQTYISLIERGRREIRDIGFLLQIARVLGIPPADVGLSNELMTESAGQGHRQRQDHPHPPGGSSRRLAGPQESVLSDQSDWRAVRRYLNHHRGALAGLAAGLYPASQRIRRTTLIAPPSWLPPEPVDLADITMTWVPDAPAAKVTGAEPETRKLRPLRVPGRQFDRYTSAIRYLDPPSLFENRPSYRLLSLAWAGRVGAMRFSLATYFDKLDVSEAIGHEMAELRSRKDTQITSRDLPFRSLIDDPFDCHRRAMLPAITTLTLRRGRGGESFLLHWRDPRKVATAAGVYDVIPAGEFQPSSIAPHDLVNDFDIWRNIVREFSEELLGTPEHDGTRSSPIDYDGWPLYRDLGRARAEGKVSAVCLGAGVDALTLAATILTVVIIDAEVFDELLADAVQVNAEGLTLFGEDGDSSGTGIEFSERNVTRLLENEPMASPGAACLALAWRNRIALLAR
jgi:transcriptional regulator with XRE-family HTH domain